MATRIQMQNWLRRRLQETTPAQWSNSSLQEYLNEGYRELGDAIKAVDPEWLVYVDTHNIAANEALYRYPSNMDTLIEVWYRGSAAAEYTRVDWRRRRSQDNDAADATGVSYSTQGRYIRLHPTPSAAISAGLRIKYVPVMSLGEDSSVPELPSGLHRAIVLAAQLLALGDTSETTDKKAVREELDRFLVRAQQFYDVNRDEDEFLTPDLDLFLFPDGMA